MKILVFDTETTGLPERSASIKETDKWPYIIQISYIFYDLSNTKTVIRDDYIKINSNIEIPSESFEKHKISKEILNEKGINIKSALLQFNDYVKMSDLIIGHNISFDKRMVYVECFRNNLKQYFTTFRGNQKISKPEYCTMNQTKEFCNLVRENKYNKEFLKAPKLLELYQILFPQDKSPENLHNSLVDVLVTFRCYIKIVYSLDIIEVDKTIYNLFINNNII
tara:strand:+ start:378 stop:1046 length:669 start_codon:yes stop_codon:yes gene_type:complete